MALNKNKLTDISYARGFSVENLEVIDRQLRECVNALHEGNFNAAGATAAALAARAKALTDQCFRFNARTQARKDEVR